MQRLPIQTFPWQGGHYLAKTCLWVDPQESLVGFDMPENDLHTLVYQATRG
jgi:hypothetical protein